MNEIEREGRGLIESDSIKSKLSAYFGGVGRGGLTSRFTYLSRLFIFFLFSDWLLMMLFLQIYTTALCLHPIRTEIFSRKEKEGSCRLVQKQSLAAAACMHACSQPTHAWIELNIQRRDIYIEYRVVCPNLNLAVNRERELFENPSAIACSVHKPPCWKYFSSS